MFSRGSDNLFAHPPFNYVGCSQKEFIYKDSLKGMFVGENVKQRFFSNRHRRVAFMTDDGEIDFPPILESEDMD